MLRIAIAGLGTIGTGTVHLLQKNAALVASRAGQEVVVKAVSDPQRNRERPGCDFSGINWLDDARELAKLPDIDLIFELIGGAEGGARELAEAALKAGRHYVTANKALIAAHGAELAALADQHKAQLQFEASVGGGIPVIKTLREGMIGNNISSVRGI